MMILTLLGSQSWDYLTKNTRGKEKTCYAHGFYQTNFMYEWCRDN